jgi:hypothetical protein
MAVSCRTAEKLKKAENLAHLQSKQLVIYAVSSRAILF